MVLSEGPHERQQSIKVRLRKPSEFLGDEFALAHLLSTSDFTAFPFRANGRLKYLEEERADGEIARKIYELRMAAGLTQTQLAKLIATTASVICRLEDADYSGHSLAMLRRIAAALRQRVEIRFVPIRRSA